MSRGSSFILAKNMDQTEKRQGYEWVGSDVLGNYAELSLLIMRNRAEGGLASKY